MSEIFDILPEADPDAGSPAPDLLNGSAVMSLLFRGWQTTIEQDTAEVGFGDTVIAPPESLTVQDDFFFVEPNCQII